MVGSTRSTLDPQRSSQGPCHMRKPNRATTLINPHGEGCGALDIAFTPFLAVDAELHTWHGLAACFRDGVATFHTFQCRGSATFLFLGHPVLTHRGLRFKQGGDLCYFRFFFVVCFIYKMFFVRHVLSYAVKGYEQYYQKDQAKMPFFHSVLQ